MNETHESLTGQWFGRFEYDRGGVAAAFEAELSEADGAVRGQTIEPNSFRKDMGAELIAQLTGSRVEEQVSFFKRYIGFDQGDLLIYDGKANAGLSRIEGRWRFNSQPNWGGRFVMFRRKIAFANQTTKRLEGIEF